MVDVLFEIDTDRISSKKADLMIHRPNQYWNSPEPSNMGSQAGHAIA